jgi:hypothetical protein
MYKPVDAKQAKKEVCKGKETYYFADTRVVNSNFFLTNTMYHSFPPNDNDFILSIVKVLIAKHLDASDTLNYEILLPIHCNSCITIFDPNFLGIDTTYKNLSLHVKSIYERL